jgi:hypothetical protein
MSEQTKAVTRASDGRLAIRRADGDANSDYSYLALTD